MAIADPTPVLVDPEVSRLKLDHELTLWTANAAAYRRRGWILLGVDGLVVDIAIAAQVALSPPPLIALLGGAPVPVPVLTACLRLEYSNYDLWPPSLTFVDLFSGLPAVPHVRAIFPEGSELRDALVDQHPLTGLPFLCLPGIREYHSHPQHTGDDWLLHRSSGAAGLATICDRVWRFMARNVIGFRVISQTLPSPLAPQLDVRLAQGDVDAILAQLLPSPPPAPVSDPLPDADET